MTPTSPSTTPASPAPASITCPSCAAPASGRFCASCGAPLQGATCTGCHTALTPGARFCHRCGTPAGAEGAHQPRDASSALPWAVAGIALVALIALVAGQRIGARRTPQPAPDAATADAGGMQAPFAGGGAGAQGVVRAPDISQMSPEERADRLFNRVMLLHEQGKDDSVAFFAPMAIQSYRMLGTLNDDQHYDLGHIAEVAGAFPLAQAQADTILAHDPTHLLGLILAAGVARAAGDEKGARAFDQRLVAAAPAELKKNLPEYQRHRNDIEAALAAVKSRG